MPLAETDRRRPGRALLAMGAAAAVSIVLLGDRAGEDEEMRSPEASQTFPTAGTGGPAVTPPTVGAEASTVLVDLGGVGLATSAEFRPGPEWSLAWAYDCSQAPAAAPGFTVTLLADGADAVTAVDQDQRQASGVERLTAAGPLRLRLNGACPWTVQVHG